MIRRRHDVFRPTGSLAARLTFALTCAFAAGVACAQSYPAKPVRVIVPISPGGNVDIIARTLAQRLTQSMGQQFIVDNRPGASSIIGSEVVAKSPADGYTLLLNAAGSHTINPGLFQKLPYDTVRDFAPITTLARTALIMVVHPSLPAKSVKDLIALAKARPGAINAATGGNGTAGHMALELFMSMSGTKVNHIPYKGNAPGLADTIAGHTVMMIDTLSTSLALVKAGKLRALGMTSAQRSPLLPELPTVAEAALPGFQGDVFILLLAPAGTPREIAARLHSELVRIGDNAELRERFAQQGTDLMMTTPEQSAAFIQQDIAKWRKVIAQAGIKVD
jgi:tripartite-type tricarboxylate transporter receptor subunit TctC